MHITSDRDLNTRRENVLIVVAQRGESLMDPWKTLRIIRTRVPMFLPRNDDRKFESFAIGNGFHGFGSTGGPNLNESLGTPGIAERT